MPNKKILGILSMLFMLTLVISGCSNRSQNSTDPLPTKTVVKSPSPSSEAESKGAVKQVSAKELSDLLVQGKELKLIDVSTPGEFREGHIEGSLLGNIQMLGSQPEEYLNQIKINKSDSILLICETGKKSYRVAEGLIGAGYQNVNNLDEGKIGWIRAGFRMVEGDS